MDAKQTFENWKEWFANDEAMALELGQIENDDGEIAERFYQDLSFGTAGMRGVLGAGTNRMNRYVVRRATKGLCDYILSTGASPSVAIGYDSRHMSREFALETALTCAACGVTAYLFDALRPVALLSYAVRHLKATAGVVITASHNPKEYNGYKVYWSDGAQMPPERAEQVLECIRAVDYARLAPMAEDEAVRKGLLAYIGKAVDESYYQKVLGLSILPDLCRENGGDVRIVYTPLNGSGTVPVCEVLKRAGFSDVSVVPEQKDPDPFFTTVGVPNPENRDAFGLALKLADEKNADLVFATDPDCDRVGVAARKADGDYALLSGNQIGCLLTDYILSGLKDQDRLPQNGAIVKSIVSTSLAAEIAGRFGVAAFDVLTGFKFIAEKIQEFEDTGSHKYLFGFEESYGYLSGTFVRDKDGVNASLLLAEAALWHKQNGRTLYEALLALYSKYGWGLEDVHSVSAKGMDGQARMTAAMASLRESPPEGIAGLVVTAVRDYKTGLRNGEPMGLPPSDVLYYELEGGSWVCIRPSGTEPKIKLYINVMEQSQKAAETLLAKVKASAISLMNAALGE